MSISELRVPYPVGLLLSLLFRKAGQLFTMILRLLGLAALPAAAKHMWVRDVFGKSSRFQEISIAVDVALKCGENMRKCQGVTSAAGIAWKGDSASIDPVTATDEENERLVQEALMKAFPAHQMIGEESATAGGIPALTDAPTWIVDPIDGTANFVHGNTLSCVSIGQAVNKVPELGIVYDPYLDELYVAVRGQGAFCNGQPVRVHTPAPAFDRSLIVTEPGYERSPEGIAKVLATTKALLETNVQALRMNGSAVLSIIWVACGRANGYFAGLHEKDCPKPWDWCAGYVIAKEAGATFARVDERSYPGGPGTGSDSVFDVYSKSVIVSCSPQMTADLRALIHKAYETM
jgi:fructose-1,6-bisphosphatase/inositol monophosphatase family enzyme